MVRFACGQLVWVALTACVGAQSSGFLKSQTSSEFRNIFPVLSVLQQEAANAADAKLDAGNVKEDAVLRATQQKMEQRHILRQKQLKVALERYDKITTAKQRQVLKKKIDSVIDSAAAVLKKKIKSNCVIAQKSMRLRQKQENQLFLRRKKCCQEVPGDQSSGCLKVAAPGCLKVAACMKKGALLEKPPFPDNLGLTQNEQAAVKTQTDRFQEMQEHAMNDTLEGLFNTEQKYEQDTWQTISQELQEYGLTTGTEM